MAFSSGAMKRGRWLGAAVLALGLVRAPDAAAFCGFYVGGAGAKLYNDATVVVLMREGTRTVLSMQNAYKGPPERFAMVVPVPVVLQEQNVKTLPRTVFEKIDQLAAPRLVEYWEQDPCAPPVPQSVPMPAAAAPAKAAPRSAGRAEDYGVKVEAQFTVGEYQIVILSAKDSGGLEAWLHKEQYAIPDGAEPYLRPYVTGGSKFFVARVDVTKVKMENGVALLSPLRFHYDADAFSLPVRLGLINSSGTQDLLVHILARGKRYEVANYPNVTIPTNLDVAEAARDAFPTFYTALFDRTVAKTPKAVVTEYAWDAGSCDPCPGPVLDPNDLMTLGGDVIDRSAPPAPRFFGGGGFTLTRLHARYSKEALGEDLVFREAKAIVGGRENRDASGQLETGAKPAEYGGSNFQARYAVRHPWTGPITCKDPRRGIWGGPPDGAMPKPKPAAKIGLAPRGDADLAKFLKTSLADVALPNGATVETSASAAPTIAPASSTPDVPTPADAGPSVVDASASQPGDTKKGCAGCAATTREAPRGLGALVAALALAAVRRRRR